MSAEGILWGCVLLFEFILLILLAKIGLNRINKFFNKKK